MSIEWKHCEGNCGFDVEIEGAAYLPSGTVLCHVCYRKRQIAYGVPDESSYYNDDRTWHKANEKIVGFESNFAILPAPPWTTMETLKRVRNHRR